MSGRTYGQGSVLVCIRQGSVHSATLLFSLLSQGCEFGWTSPSGTVLQWLRLNSFLTTLIVDLREDLDSFQSWLGFKGRFQPHVEPHIGSFPALQNLHLPLGDAFCHSSGVVADLPTLFPCLKSFRVDEWVEMF
jgi:hypothetical protein